MKRGKDGRKWQLEKDSRINFSKRVNKSTKLSGKDRTINIREKLRELARARENFLAGMGKPDSSEFVADSFQLQAIKEVLNFRDTLVVAPTGSGKTFIAISAISVYLEMGIPCIYTTPLKALSNTKFIEFKERFKGFKVGILTGDRKIDTDGDLVIATTEIFRNELLRTNVDWGLAVIDEAHFIGDPQRGCVWEESIILCPKKCNLLLLSATIGNPEFVRDWISTVRGKQCSLVLESRRPVELRYGVIHPDFGLMPVEFYKKYAKEVAWE